MSEYWKSVPRKFCDFCKCWITDNKPSVEFHEKGKRHQENVQLRLKEVRKKSLEQSAAQEKLDKQMEKMEKAAIDAFKKDLKDNPELAAKYGVSLEPKPKSEDDKSSTNGLKKDKPINENVKTLKTWVEAETPEGYKYYWNIETNESVWEPPEEYVSLKEQEEQKKEMVTDKEDTPEKNMKKTIDPAAGRSAYGAWSVVQETEQAVYDESSEAPPLDDIPLPTVKEESTEKRKFKEKTVQSLESNDSGPVTFKKRKITSGARNSRRKVDD